MHHGSKFPIYRLFLWAIIKWFAFCIIHAQEKTNGFSRPFMKCINVVCILLGYIGKKSALTCRAFRNPRLSFHASTAGNPNYMFFENLEFWNTLYLQKAEVFKIVFRCKIGNPGFILLLLTGNSDIIWLSSSDVGRSFYVENYFTYR